MVFVFMSNTRVLRKKTQICHKNIHSALQCYTGFEDCNLSIASLFLIDELSIGCFNDELSKPCGQTFHIFAIEQCAGIKVNPMRFLLCQAVVRGNLHRWHKCAERSSSAGGEKNHLTTACSQGGGCHQVVSRSAEQIQALSRQSVAIA